VFGSSVVVVGKVVAVAGICVLGYYCYRRYFK